MIITFLLCINPLKDVYKRQVIKNKLLSLEAMKVVTKRGKETWVSKGRTYMIDNEAPVSYTHLDVYKRQILN